MIQNLQELNENLTEAQSVYLESKLRLKTTEAELWISPEVNWESVVGKSKPTQKDKESWITTQVEHLREEVDEHFVNLQYLQRKYEIAKMEAATNVE